MAAKKGRHAARRLLVQAFYQKQLSDHSVSELASQFAERPEFAKADDEYFSELLNIIADNTAELDADIDIFGDIPPEQLDPVEHAVLWVALAELRKMDSVPPKVIINEAIELTKSFGAEGGYKFVNGLLDKAAAKLR
jgi:N utilization substance protein B